MDKLLDNRVRKMCDGSGVGECILYIMSRDQRAQDNFALLAAQKEALAKKLPLAVVFCLQNKTGVRAREHYEFMLEGLRQVESYLKKYDIPFMMVIGNPIEKLSAVFHHTKPTAVYFDFNPLRHSQALLQHFTKLDFALYVVDAHNIVPAWIASDKREVGARTLRTKIHKLLATCLTEPGLVVRHPYNWPGVVQELNILEPLIKEVVAQQKPNGTKIAFESGEGVAFKMLEDFVAIRLKSYAADGGNPTKDAQSNLSPYLHFGQISSLRIALRMQEESAMLGNELHLLNNPKMPKPEDTNSQLQQGIDKLLEELIVRKELADNFCYYCPDYDNINAASNWAKKSLDKHRKDMRQFLYTYKQLEQAKTHDPAWNAAQEQLTTTGKMHGYMRMYWAKKVLEWTESPELAIQYLIKLNDFYSIDGGDPNGYAGILWSIAGVHDRPWREREIFGMVRYMNDKGLKRKFGV